MKTIKAFVSNDSGVGGAELALLTILGLGLIALVANKLAVGSGRAAGDAEKLLTGAIDVLARPESQGGK